MTVVWHDRTEWQDPAELVTGPDFPAWSQITDGIVVHWPGHNKMPTTPAAVPKKLRADQHYYLTSRGYSYGYNFVIDPFGDIWEIRGYDFRNAANKGAPAHGHNVNHRSISVQVMYAMTGGTVNARQMTALRSFVAETWARAGRELDINPHSYWENPDDGGNGTQCCGDPLRSLIAAGEAVPIPPTPPAPEEPMRTIHRFYGYADAFEKIDGRWSRLSAATLQPGDAANIPAGGAGDPDRTLLRSVLHQTGLDAGLDLTPRRRAG